jgi:hypothetical protein
MPSVVMRAEAPWRRLRPVFLLLAAGPVAAQPLIEPLQPLDFGTLAIPANDSIGAFTYPRSGHNASIEGHLVRVAPGMPGRYALSGFPADTLLDVTLEATTLTAGGSGIPEPLQVVSYDVGELRSNALGEAELVLGARLTTTGNGGVYQDAPYHGTTVLRLDYWHPDEKAYVFSVETIDLKAEVRSTLAVEQVSALNFGTLFARATPDHQARLTLAPNGAIDISNPGTSRFVSLSRPEPAVIRVSGAAPNYLLQITPQASEVQLRHTQNPLGSPHFILDPLVTSPAGSGTTDANGELVIRVGGTLHTALTPTVQIYPSGTYQGSYELTVEY